MELRKLTDPPGLVCLSSPPHPMPLPWMSLPFPGLLVSVPPPSFLCSLPMSFACFFSVCHDLLPLPSPLPPPHVSLWAPPSPVASFLPDREDYGVRGHSWPVL